MGMWVCSVGGVVGGMWTMWVCSTGVAQAQIPSSAEHLLHGRLSDGPWWVAAMWRSGRVRWLSEVGGLAT